MQLSLREIYAADQPLAKLSQLDLPGKVAFRIVWLLDQIVNHIKKSEEVKTKLAQKHGDIIGENKYHIKEENKAEYIKEINELLDEKVELNFEPLDPSLLEETKLKAVDLYLLRFFFQGE